MFTQNRGAYGGAYGGTTNGGIRFGNTAYGPVASPRPQASTPVLGKKKAGELLEELRKVDTSSLDKLISGICSPEPPLYKARLNSSICNGLGPVNLPLVEVTIQMTALRQNIGRVLYEDGLTPCVWLVARETEDCITAEKGDPSRFMDAQTVTLVPVELARELAEAFQHRHICLRSRVACLNLVRKAAYDHAMRVQPETRGTIDMLKVSTREREALRVRSDTAVVQTFKRAASEANTLETPPAKRQRRQGPAGELDEIQEAILRFANKLETKQDEDVVELIDAALQVDRIFAVLGSGCQTMTKAMERMSKGLKVIMEKQKTTEQVSDKPVIKVKLPPT